MLGANEAPVLGANACQQPGRLSYIAGRGFGLVCGIGRLIASQSGCYNLAGEVSEWLMVPLSKSGR